MNSENNTTTELFNKRFDSFIYQFDELVKEVKVSTNRSFIDSTLIKLERALFFTCQFNLNENQTKILDKAIWDLTVAKADIYLNNLAFHKDFEF
jgi:hypothetical protein